MTKNQRGYHAFIKKATAKFKLTARQARQVYRDFKSKYGGYPNSRAISDHPIVAKRFATAATRRNTKRDGGQRAGGKLKQASGYTFRSGKDIGGGGSVRRDGGSFRGGSAGAKSNNQKGASSTINTIEQWLDNYDDFPDADIEYDSSADYGED